MLLDDKTGEFLSDTLLKLILLCKANFVCRKAHLNQQEIVERFIKCNKRLVAYAKVELGLISTDRVEKINRVNELFQMIRDTEAKIEQLKQTIEVKEKTADRVRHQINEINEKLNKPRFNNDESLLGYLVTGLTLAAKVSMSDYEGIMHMLEESKRDLLIQLNSLETELNYCSTVINNKLREIEEKEKEIKGLEKEKDYQHKKQKFINYCIIIFDDIILSARIHQMQIENLQCYKDPEKLQDKIQSLSESIEKNINEITQEAQSDELIEFLLKDLSCTVMEKMFDSEPFQLYGSVPFQV